MQEQVPSNITPDHGWSQMRTILDREMPVSRHSRRGIFFWRSLMAVGLLASFGYLIRDNIQGVNPAKDNAPLQEEQRINRELPEKETPKPIEQAANDPSSQAQQQVAALTEVSEVTSNTPAYISNQQASANASNHTSAAIAKAKTTAVKKADQELAEENSNSLSIDRQTHTAVTPTALVIERSVSNSADNNEVTASAVNPGNDLVDEINRQASSLMRNGQVVSALPGLAISQLPFSDSDELDLAYIVSTPVIVHKSTVKRAIAPYVSTLAMAGYNSGAAWQGGAGISVSALPKLRLSAGVSYRTYNPRFSLARLESDQSQGGPALGESIVQADGQYPGIPNYVEEFSLNASTAYQSIEPLVKSVRQWQIDAGISYDVSKRWFLQTGIAYALQTSAYSAYPIIEDPFTADSTRVSVNHELEDYDLIRNGMITVSGGIGYHIGNKLDVSIEAVHSFQPYLQPDPVSLINFPGSTERNDFIRGISVGAKYRI